MIMRTAELGKILFQVEPLPKGWSVGFCPEGCLRVWNEKATVAQLAEQSLRKRQVRRFDADPWLQ